MSQFISEFISKYLSKKTVRIVILALCLCVLIISITYFVKDRLQHKEFEDLKQEASVSSGEETTDEEIVIPVDFEKLKKANPDIYAWISIPAANVDYPILQSEDDNGYYLNHTVNGTKSVYGSIYTEDYNSKDFSDFNTVIYGHNMKNGTMFGSLKKFRDASFFNENRFITIYAPDRVLKYEIFAATTWDNQHILLSRNFERRNNCRIYLDEIFAVRDMNSQIKKDMSVTADDKIITLSTCMNDKSKRFLVSGVLVYDSAED